MAGKRAGRRSPKVSDRRGKSKQRLIWFLMATLAVIVCGAIRYVTGPEQAAAVPPLSTAGNAGAPAWVGKNDAFPRRVLPSLTSACS